MFKVTYKDTAGSAILQGTYKEIPPVGYELEIKGQPYKIKTGRFFPELSNSKFTVVEFTLDRKGHLQ